MAGRRAGHRAGGASSDSAARAFLAGALSQDRGRRGRLGPEPRRATTPLQVVTCQHHDVMWRTSNLSKYKSERIQGSRMIRNFLQELRTQRWDDHRYYHHSRINQSLHFVSAASFLFSYAMLFFDPMVSALVGWLVSMTTRQAGHFFFEPKGYDHVNQATHEHKEDIKVGYNLQRKVVLMAIWALSPVVLFFSPTLFG